MFLVVSITWALRIWRISRKAWENEKRSLELLTDSVIGYTAMGIFAEIDSEIDKIHKN